MKKFIKWLADISGLTNEIETEERKRIGYNLVEAGHWFTGGIMHDQPILEVANFAVLYGEDLIEGHYNGHLNSIRPEVYKMQSQNLNIYKDREVYGYWRDNPADFIAKEDYNGEEGYKPRLKIKWK